MGFIFGPKVVRRSKKAGKVYLVGAGPGDPKLLTLKAVEVLASSDVVIYDHLVNPEILGHVRRGAELIYAGKHPGSCSLSQDQINRLMIDRAVRGQNVARLKGGDPLIFGRGGEELEALAEAGLQWEIIPGVSSGIASAAYAGIPLTHRDHSSSVAFVTGHDGCGKRRQPVNWNSMAGAADTLVIFMCAATIAKIARELQAAGLAPDTPVAIIRWCTYREQQVYHGSLEEAAELGPDSIRPPAIAIIGQVVRLREKLRWFGNPALEAPLKALIKTAQAEMVEV